MPGAALALILGIVVFSLVYHFYAKWVDRRVISADPERSTPARTYMDGVEFFPTNKNVLFGFQFKGIVGLAPVVGPIVAIMWGWLPALLWIIFGVTFIGWVQDYMSTMVSVRSDGKSFGPLSYSLIGSRTRKLLLLFMVFYLFLLCAAFAAVGANLLKANVLAVAPVAVLLLVAVLFGHMVYKMKMSPVTATAIALGLIIIGLFVGSNVPVSIANVDVWVVLVLLVSIIAATTPIWRFTQPILYLFFYVVYFSLILLVLALVFGNPTYVRPAFAGFVAPNGWPLWPLLFVVIACGAISGWHSLVSSSSTAKQIDKETDVLPICGGSMMSEGILGLVALSIVAVLTLDEATALGGPAAIFSKSGASLLGGSAVAQSLVGTMFVGLALGVLVLAIRIARITLSELAGDAIPALKNIYVSAIVFSVVVFILASPSIGALWLYIWVLFGGANQLMAGLALWIAALWLLNEKKPWIISGIPGVFMIVTTIAALVFASYGVLTKGLGFLATGETVKAGGNIIAGVIGATLVIAALIMCVDIYNAFGRIKAKPAPKVTAADGGEEE
ncbi:MAG: carbon starvation protein A [Candidatus Hydrothermarchaeales archaeon]